MKKQIHIDQMVFEPFLLEENIHQRIKEMGHSLSKKFKGERPVFLCVLKGSVLFFADLVREIDPEIELEMDFIRVSSYEGIHSLGSIKLNQGLSVDIKGRDVVVLEDIIDLGTTIEFLDGYLRKLEPRSVSIVSLLLKPEVYQKDITLDYIGFEIPKEFVIGYGLDYNQKYRHLKDIYRRII